MSSAEASRAKNQTLDCFKVIAAILVIFIHVPLPGSLGRNVTCFSRFAVPFFFAVSGYFSFSIQRGKLVKRMLHIVKLNLLAVAVYTIWFILRDLSLGRSLSDPLQLHFFTRRNLFNWLVLHINPYAGHLWYLTAIFVCYAFLWLYAGFFKNRPVRYAPLGVIALILFIIRFIVGDLLRLVGLDIPYYICRDGWFLGLPMFTLGILLNQYQEHILKSRFAKDIHLLLLFLAGVVLTLVQSRFWGSELPFGAVLQTVALVLFAVRHPKADLGSSRFAQLIASFGTLSTSIYIVHIAVWEACLSVLHPYLTKFFGDTLNWALSFVVLLITLAVSIAFEMIAAGIRSLSKRRFM